MRAKPLRDLQQQGEKAIIGDQPILLTNRRGPVGVLIPVTQDSLPLIQAETEKWMALQSLKKTWALAREAGLDQLTLIDIDREIKQVRRKKNSKK